MGSSIRTPPFAALPRATPGTQRRRFRAPSAPATNAVRLVDSVPDVDETPLRHSLRQAEPPRRSRQFRPGPRADGSLRSNRTRCPPNRSPAETPATTTPTPSLRETDFIPAQAREVRWLVASTTTLNERTPGAKDHVSLACVLHAFTDIVEITAALLNACICHHWHGVYSQSDSVTSAATPVSSALSSPCALVGADNTGFGNHASGRRSR